ncbi:MAG: ABC transporter permease [Acidimicrobiia bacterium]|nr:MAG: ABC transporter permease [Acidimicrobiia bacterium]
MTPEATAVEPHVREPSVAPGPAPVPAARGRREHPLARLRGELPMAARVALAAVGVVSLLACWLLASTLWSSGAFRVPTPLSTLRAGVELWTDGDLGHDLLASSRRVAVGYAISLAIGVVAGIGIGSFASLEAYGEAPIGLVRYVPATALTPLFLLWLGIDEAPKVALVVAGTVFYNVLMIADVARAVPRDMVTSAYTLGAGRWTVLRRVVFPHSWPGIVDVARVNLAGAWLMLVVAELLAANEGLAFQLTRAYRFRRVDTMFAILVVFAVIGVASDLFLRWLRNRTAPWARS